MVNSACVVIRTRQEGEGEMLFIPSVTSPEEHLEQDLIFVFQKDLLLTRVDGTLQLIPTFQQIQALEPSFSRKLYLGTLDGIHCYAAELDVCLKLSGHYRFDGIRLLFKVLPEAVIKIAGKAFQILHWDSSHQFCGRCGNRTSTKADERVKICPTCGLQAYPRITPVIIVAVVRDGKLLLASNKSVRKDLYSLIAGFIEPGESFEEGVRREVREEVNIEIEDIHYFGSQSWPFPSSLIAGYTAHHRSGEIIPDGVEIGHADWFSPDSMPPIPPPGSISRRLIDWFVAHHARNNGCQLRAYPAAFRRDTDSN